MSKMGQELEKRLNENKYEMREAIENASVNMTILKRTKLNETQQWYVDDTLREVNQVLSKIEGMK